MDTLFRLVQVPINVGQPRDPWDTLKMGLGAMVGQPRVRQTGTPGIH
jgi:hypothetical protein